MSLPGFARRIWRRAERTASTPGLALDEEFLRRLERLSLLARQSATGGIGGEHRSAARAPSTEFADHRSYQPGDDFRRIDWNAYGRLGHLYVKVTEAREQVVLHVLLDASGSMDWGEPSKLDYARRVAAAISYVALTRFDRVTVTTLGAIPHVFPLVRGRARFHELLAFLDRIEPGGGMRMDEQLATYRPNRRRRGQVILLSDMLAPEGYQDGLDRMLRAGFEVVVLHLLSPQELEPERVGDAELVDAETNERVEVTLTAETIARYRERLDRWCAEVEAFCVERGIRYQRISTTTPFDELLLDTFRRGLILR